MDGIVKKNKKMQRTGHRHHMLMVFSYFHCSGMKTDKQLIRYSYKPGKWYQQITLTHCGKMIDVILT